MSLREFMANVVADNEAAREVDDVVARCWARWARIMRRLRQLAADERLAAAAATTVCFSQAALRSDARYYRKMARAFAAI